MIEGDCLDAMSALPDHSIDFVLYDLPYGTTQNRWDSALPMDVLWEHYKRILAPTGAVALMSHGAFTAKVILSEQDWFKYKIVWVKSKATNFLNAKNNPFENTKIFASSTGGSRHTCHKCRKEKHMIKALGKIN